jgi:hypothetical protein
MTASTLVSERRLWCVTFKRATHDEDHLWAAFPAPLNLYQTSLFERTQGSTLSVGPNTPVVQH